MKGIVLSVTTVGLLFAAIVQPAPVALLAAHKADKSTSSISLVLPSGASEPRFGDHVTFSVSTATAYPYVNLKCYQNGNLIGEGWAGFFDGALGDRTFGLYSPQWTGGAADCTAYLDMNSNGKWKQLASTSFHVDP
jgi:hypothetical protein